MMFRSLLRLILYLNKTVPDTLKVNTRRTQTHMKSPLKLLSAPRRSSHSAKPMVGSSEEDHRRNNLLVGASTPPIWTPPWAPGGDLYRRHDLAIVGPSVEDHTKQNFEDHRRNNLLVGASTPPIWTPPWAPDGDLYKRHDLAIVGPSVEDHTKHNFPFGASTPPIWTPQWVPGGDWKMYRGYNLLMGPGDMGPRMKPV